jgi:hypothetical protein
MRGWILLCLRFFRTRVGTGWRTPRRRGDRGFLRDVLSRRAGWMLSPILHAGLACLAALWVLGPLPKRELRSPEIRSWSAAVVPSDLPRLSFVREPDLPRYGRPASEDLTPASSSELLGPPDGPFLPIERFLLEPAARVGQALGPLPPTPAPESGPAWAQGALAGALPLRTPAPRRGPMVRPAKFRGAKTPHVLRAAPSLEARLRSSGILAPNLSRKTGSLSPGQRRMTGAVGSAAGAGILARARLVPAPGAAVPRPGESLRRIPNPASLDGTEFHSIPLLSSGVLNGTSLRSAPGSLNGTDFRIRR